MVYDKGRVNLLTNFWIITWYFLNKNAIDTRKNFILANMLCVKSLLKMYIICYDFKRVEASL